MYKGHRVGVVVLAYNVSGLIGETVRDLPDYADRIYIVDDGSSDGTAEQVESFNHSRVRLIQHKTNMGPGAALSTGYRAALTDEMDIIVKVDGDAQMAGDQMERLINPVAEGSADYSKGDRLSRRVYRQGMPRFRLFGNLLLTRLTRIASGYWHLNDAQNGFTAISRAALTRIDLKLYPFYGYLNGMLVQLNVHNAVVRDVPMPARYGRERSSIRLGSYVPKVSWYLLRCLLWRVTVKYLRRGNYGSRSATGRT